TCALPIYTLRAASTDPTHTTSTSSHCWRSPSVRLCCTLRSGSTTRICMRTLPPRPCGLASHDAARLLQDRSRCVDGRTTAVSDSRLIHEPIRHGSQGSLTPGLPPAAFRNAGRGEYSGFPKVRSGFSYALARVGLVGKC